MRSTKGMRVAGVLSALAVATSSLTIAAVMPAGATTTSTTTPTSTGSTSTTTGGTTACASVARLAGIDRIATAIATSMGAFPGSGSAKAVVLAQDLDFPDALAGGPLAADVGAPLLLTAPNVLSSATLTEIKRALPAGGTVVLLGGTSALTPAVETALTNAGFKPKRIAGTNRFASGRGGCGHQPHHRI